MKKLIAFVSITAVAAAGIFVFAGCPAIAVYGSGAMIRHEIEIKDSFTGIEAGGIFIVSFRFGHEVSVVMYAQQNVFDVMETTVHNQNLRVSSARRNLRLSVTSGNTPRLYVVAPSLTRLNLSGAAVAADWDTITINAPYFQLNLSGSARANIDFNTGRLDIRASGSSSLTTLAEGLGFIDASLSGSSGLMLSGQAERANLRISGSSNVAAFGLETLQTAVNASGSSRADINASDTIVGSASGSSRIRHRGGASVSVSTSGSASVQRAD